MTNLYPTREVSQLPGKSAKSKISRILLFIYKEISSPRLSTSNVRFFFLRERERSKVIVENLDVIPKVSKRREKRARGRAVAKIVTSVGKASWTVHVRPRGFTFIAFSKVEPSRGPSTSVPVYFCPDTLFPACREGLPARPPPSPRPRPRSSYARVLSPFFRYARFCPRLYALLVVCVIRALSP